MAIDGSELSLNAAEKALDLARFFGANLYAITVSYIPESYHLQQEDVLNKSKNMKDSMTDAKKWLDNFMQDAKKYNVILKTELINSHRPVDYVKDGFDRNGNKRKFWFKEPTARKCRFICNNVRSLSGYGSKMILGRSYE